MGGLVLPVDITGGTGAMEGDVMVQSGVPFVQCASCRGALDVGALREHGLAALPSAAGPAGDPPTLPPPSPRRSTSPPSPDGVCRDRRSGPWKNTMEGPHKGGFIQICLEFSGFA